MGLFDKLKTMAGKHGCTVEITSIEGQDPSDVTFPIMDSVVKGKYNVCATNDCTILSHIHEFIVEYKMNENDFTDSKIIAEDENDKNTEIIGSDMKWPYQLGAGKSISQSFSIVNVDISAVLKELGISDPQAAIDSKKVNFFVRVTADVKGTLIDCECKVPIKVV